MVSSAVLQGLRAICAGSALLFAATHSLPAQPTVPPAAMAPEHSGAAPLPKDLMAKSDFVSVPDSAATPHGSSVVADSSPIPARLTTLISGPGMGQFPVNDTVSYLPGSTLIAVSDTAANQILQVSFSGLQFFDRKLAPQGSPVDLDVFAGLGPGNTPNDTLNGYHRVFWDQATRKFAVFMSSRNFDAQRYLHTVAVSRTANTTPITLAEGDWTKTTATAIVNFAGVLSQTVPFLHAAAMDDTRLVVTSNAFSLGSSAFQGVVVRTYDRQQLFEGNLVFGDAFLPSSQFPNVFNLQPVKPAITGDPTGASWAIGTGNSQSLLSLVRITGPATAPVVSTFEIQASMGQFVGAAPQPNSTGTTTSTRTIRTDNMVIHNAVYHDGSIWAVVGVDADGDGTSDLRWFRIGVSTGSPMVIDSGTLFGDERGVDWLYKGSIQVNDRGDVILAAYQSSPTRRPELVTYGRLASDPPGTFRGKTSLRQSSHEVDSFTGVNSWGLVIDIVPDPDQRETFWVSGQAQTIGQSNFSMWQSHIAQVDITRGGGRRLTSPTDAVGRLMITEVGRSEPNNGFSDFVEILNASSVTFDLQNVFVSAGASGSGTSGDLAEVLVFPGGFVLRPYQSVVVVMDRSITQERLNTIPTVTPQAPGGVLVAVPESNGLVPVRGLQHGGRPVIYLLQSGVLRTGGMISQSDVVTIGWRAKMIPPHNAFNRSFRLNPSDVIDGLGWSEVGAPTAVPWGTGLVDTLPMQTSTGTRADSFKRKSNSTGTRPIDTNTQDDWLIGTSTNLNLGGGNWTPLRPVTMGQVSGALLITEVLPSVANPLPGTDFVEFFNRSEADISLATIRLANNVPNGGDFSRGSIVFPENTIIPSQGAVVVLTNQLVTTTSAARALGNLRSAAKGGVRVFVAGDLQSGVPPLESDDWIVDEGRPVQALNIGTAGSRFDLDDNADFVYLFSTLSTAVPPVQNIPADAAFVIDGVGWRSQGQEPGIIPWGPGVLTSGNAGVLLSPTPGQSIRRISTVDTNSAADWEATLTSDPGDPGTIASEINITLELVTATPLSVPAGGEVLVQWVVRNTGLVSSPPNLWQDRVVLSADAILGNSDDVVIQTLPAPLIPGLGEAYTRSLNVTVPPSVTPGTYRFFVRADAFNGVNEFDESDNIAESDPVEVLPPACADLVVSDVTASPATILAGTTLGVAWTTSNTGTLAATGTWRANVVLSSDATIGNGDDVSVGTFTNPQALLTGEGYRQNVTVTVPESIGGGEFFVGVTEDFQGAIVECVETNNRGRTASPITVTVRLRAELTAINPVIVPASPFRGNQVTLAWRTRNQGLGPTAGATWAYEVYLSEDGVISNGDSKLASSIGFTDQLLDPAGESTITSGVVTLPPAVFGDRFLILRPKRISGPTFDTQDLAFPVTIQEGVPADLIPDNVTVTPPSPIALSNAIVSYRVRNASLERTFATSWNDEVWVSPNSDFTVETSRTLLRTVTRSGELLGNTSYTVSTSITLPPNFPELFLFVRTDSNDRVYEGAFEGNNVSAPIALTVSQTPPDLRIQNLSHIGNLVPGLPITVSFRVDNIGAAPTPAGQSWLDQVILSDSAGNVTTATVSSQRGLAFGESYVQNVPVTIPSNFLPGNLRIRVCTDSDNVIVEVREDNQCAEINRTLLTGRPDLAPGRPQPIAGSIPGQTIDVFYSVLATGPLVSGTIPTTDTLWLSNSITLTTAAIRLADVARTGATADLKDLPVPNGVQGLFFLLVQVDSPNAVDESNESNNVNSSLKGIEVGGLPDLIPENLTGTGTVGPGTNVIAGYRLRNQGDIPSSSRNQRVELWASRDDFLDRNNDLLLGAETINVLLAPGTSESLTIRGTIPRSALGDYRLLLFADAGNSVPEKVETNNVAIAPGLLTVAVPGPTDLQAVSVDPITTLAVSGNPFDLSWTVRNNSADTTVTTQFEDRVYLSRDAVLSPDDITLAVSTQNQPLNPGSSYTKDLNGGLTSNQAQVTGVRHFPGVLPGTYNLLLRADSRAVVNDPNRANNTVVSVGTIQTTVTVLPVGGSAPGFLGPTPIVPGQLFTGFNYTEQYYAFEFPQGIKTVQLDISTTTGPFGNLPRGGYEIFTRLNAIPTPTLFDTRLEGPLTLSPKLFVPRQQGGVCYVLVRAVPQGALDGTQQQFVFDLAATGLPFGVLSIDPPVIGNNGPVTLKLTASDFDTATSLTLVNEARNLDDGVPSGPVFRGRGSTVYATFDPRNVIEPGAVDVAAMTTRRFFAVDLGSPEVRLETDIEESRLTGSLVALAGGQSVPSIQINAPGAIRFGQAFQATITYGNIGNIDRPSPILAISSLDQNADLGTSDATAVAGQSVVYFMPLQSEGPRTAIRPGERVQFQVFVRPRDGRPIRLRVSEIQETGLPLDWDEVADGYTDDNTATFVQRYGLMIGQLGGTMQEVAQTIRAQAEQLTQYQGRSAFDVATHLQVLLGDQNNGPVGDSVVRRAGLGRGGSHPLLKDVRWNPGQDLRAAGAPAEMISSNPGGLKTGSPGIGAPVPGRLSNQFDNNDIGCECPSPFFSNLVLEAARVKMLLLMPFAYAPPIFAPNAAAIFTAYLTGGGTLDFGELSSMSIAMTGEAATQDYVASSVFQAVEAKIRAMTPGQLPQFCGDQVSFPLIELLPDRVFQSINYNDANSQDLALGVGGGNIFLSGGEVTLTLVCDGCTRCPKSIRVEITGRATVEDVWDFCPSSGFVLEDGFVRTLRNATIALLRGIEACGISGTVRTNFSVVLPRYVESINMSGGLVNRFGQTYANRISGEGSSCNRDAECANPRRPGPPRRPSGPVLPPSGGSNNQGSPDGSNDGAPKEDVTIPIIVSRDPNDIAGPLGGLEDQWVPVDSVLNYLVRFENESSATAPAQRVTVSVPIDPALDQRQFAVGNFGFSGLNFEVPPGLPSYSTILDLTETSGILVEVTAGVDPITAEARWVFQALDPATLEQPEDPRIGLLPPNDVPPIGDGFLNYSIRPLPGTPSGTVATAQATIIFDANGPIDTNTWFNTLDAEPPLSSLLTVTVQPNNPLTPLIEWDANDPLPGSGVRDTTLHVSRNGGPFTAYATVETTGVLFAAEPNTTYGFVTTARDYAGNLEALPTVPTLTLTTGEAVTTTPTADLQLTKSVSDDVVGRGTTVTFTLAVFNAGPDPATSVLVEDLLPTTAPLVGLRSDFAVDVLSTDPLVRIRIPVLPAQTTATIQLDVVPSEIGLLTNQAILSSDAVDDSNLLNNVSSTSTLVADAADLSVIIAVGASTVFRDQSVFAQYVAINDGPATATMVALTASVPVGWTITDFLASDPAATVSESGETLVLSADLLAPGASTTLTVEAQSAGPGVFALTGSVAGLEADPNLTNNAVSRTVTVEPVADMALTVSVSPNPVLVGQQATLAWRVRNLGPDSATTMTLLGTLPTGLTPVSVSSVTPGVVGSIQGQVFRAEVPPLASDGESIVNVAVATSVQGVFPISADIASAVADLNLANNTASATITVNESAGFVVTYIRTDNLRNATLSEPGGTTGWFPIGSNQPGVAFPAVSPTDGFVLTIFPSPGTPRITGLMTGDSERLPFASIGTDNFVRGRFAVRADGQANPADSRQIPNLRLRLSQRFAATAMLTVFHSVPDGPADLPVTSEFRPTTASGQFSVYRVDMAPFITPQVLGNPNTESVARAIEAYAPTGSEHGRILVAESSIGTYPRAALNTSRTLARFTPPGGGGLSLGIINPGELFLTTILPVISPQGTLIVDGAAPQPVHTVTAMGVTMDTRGIPGDRIGIVSREFGLDPAQPGFAQRPRIEPGRQYIARFHLASSQPTTVQPYIRLRTRTARFGWSHTLEIGGSQAAGPLNRSLAAEILPGVGTANPDRRPGVNNGGWYTQLVLPPLNPDLRPEFPGGAAVVERFPNLTGQPGPGVNGPSLRDIRVALDMADSVSFSPEASLEQGLVELDEILILDAPAVPE